jgi:hypothetical protein
MRANPPGAVIRCELERFDRSWVTIRALDGAHIATVVVVPPAPNDVTEETVAIASALYWSWWRAEEMHGRRHEEVSP